MDWFGGNADGGFGLGGPMGGGGFGGGFGGGRGGGGQYKEYLSCMSIAMMPGRERRDADKGGKVFLPQSVLRQLTRLNIQYPMLFSLSSAKSGRKTHCGVLEFVADPGCVNVPHWMLLNLAIQEGDQVEIESVNLPTAQFAKVQPQTQDFLDISNPKAVLEKTLRNFSCLTEADMIAIEYNGKTYELVVLELRPKHPSNAVCVVECDLELDFAPPLDYVEPPKDYGHGPVTETDSAPLPTKVRNVGVCVSVCVCMCCVCVLCVHLFFPGGIYRSRKCLPLAPSVCRIVLFTHSSNHLAMANMLCRKSWRRRPSLRMSSNRTKEKASVLMARTTRRFRR
eukprot:m.52658 g.52658  ORF g.52658 m.52658 type:complete len:338 (-) comp7388_c0_seq3:733-1746(-)